MKKHKLLISALTIGIVAILAGSSLAYFTAKDVVKNDFMIAGYDPENPDKPINPNDVFSISVYETDSKKNDGSKTTVGNVYKDIQPGDKLLKDPTVENTGKYDAYIRVNVTLTKADEWTEIIPLTSDLSRIFTGFDADKWTLAGFSSDEDKNTITYSFYLNEALAPQETATLFTGITIPDFLTVDQFVSVSNFSLIISADAIQSKNTGDVANAFAIYDGLK